jgi:hypothetical protein
VEHLSGEDQEFIVTCRNVNRHSGDGATGGTIGGVRDVLEKTDEVAQDAPCGTRGACLHVSNDLLGRPTHRVLGQLSFATGEVKVN